MFATNLGNQFVSVHASSQYTASTRPSVDYGALEAGVRASIAKFGVTILASLSIYQLVSWPAVSNLITIALRFLRTRLAGRLA